MNIIDYKNSIFNIEDSVDDEFCDYIISLVDSNRDIMLKQELSNNQNRDCYIFPGENISDELDNIIFEKFSSIYFKFCSYIKNFHPGNKIPIEFDNLSDDGYRIAMYDIGSEGVKLHADCFLPETSFLRFFTSIIYLNNCDNPIEFPLQNFKIKTKRKNCVIFPSGALWPHRVCGPLKENRYCIITWFGRYIQNINN